MTALMCSVVLHLVKSHRAVRRNSLIDFRVLDVCIEYMHADRDYRASGMTSEQVDPGILPLPFVRFREIVQPFLWENVVFGHDFDRIVVYFMCWDAGEILSNIS